ncbi:MAG TPA: hypothetical protein ENJ28_07035 [Gammaproteobacteria bacterium]|nr:hypothetical protein [Gammaproteobacteria bacterium]
MFENTIFELEEYVKKTTDSLIDFENKIGNVEDALTDDQLTSFQGIASDTCEALTGIIEIFSLGEDKSPLHIIRSKIGPTLLGISEKDFDYLLNAERALLKRLGLSERSIQSAVKQMEEFKKELLQPSESFDPNDVIKTLGEFKDVVCNISKIGELQKSMVSPELVKLCVKGLIDVCVVSGDVLSVFTVPDPTPFTFLRSLKSVYSGARSLRNVSEKLGCKYRIYTKSIKSRNNLKVIRKTASANRLKKK